MSEAGRSMTQNTVFLLGLVAAAAAVAAFLIGMLTHRPLHRYAIVGFTVFLILEGCILLYGIFSD